METKILKLPIEFGRESASRLQGRIFESYDELMDTIDEMAKTKFADSADENDIAEVCMDAVRVLSIDEFMWELNDECYPTNEWVAYVQIN